MYANSSKASLAGNQLERAIEHGIYCSLTQLSGLRWRAQHLSLPKARRVSRPQSGMHRSRFRGRGMEFSEVRVYQPGDDVRSIDWRVTARRQIPHTRLYNEERERPVMILCDQSQSQFFGSRSAFKSVRAAQAAALFAWMALSHNDRVGGIVFSELQHRETKPARSRKNLLRFLQDIVDVNQALGLDHSGDTSERLSLNGALTETLRLVKPGTLIILISDFFQFDENSEALIAKLTRHNELLLIQTSDVLEEQLPPAGRYPLSDGNDTIMMDTRQTQTQRGLKEWAARREQRLSDVAMRYRCPRQRILTGDDPANALQPLLVSMGR